MKLGLALPPPQRDLRLDLFRGLANWAMFLGHVPGTVLVWCSFRNYGFSDGADLFVLVTGGEFRVAQRLEESAEGEGDPGPEGRGICAHFCS